jgi:hypothetical protein
VTGSAADIRGLAGPRFWSAALFAAALAVATVVGVARAASPDNAPVTTVVFDFELLDLSLDGEVYGENPEETARLRLISDQLRELLAASGRYKIVDASPAAERIADAGYIRTCNGCDVAIARDLGATLAVAGLVRKVSNLILSIHIIMRDAETGETVQSVSAGIRGNNDTSWSRGVAWLVRNRLLAE